MDSDRRSELAEARENLEPHTPHPDLLAEVRARVKRTIDAGPKPGRKTVIDELVHAIQVGARDDIQPWFRLPADTAASKVRVHTGLVARPTTIRTSKPWSPART